jgi:FkbM family methyltransferase
MDAVLRRIPPGVIGTVGRWQFRIPPLRWATRRWSHLLTARAGVIEHGAGSGLRFNCTGGHPGYLLGTSEPAEQEFVRRRLHSGDVFYDIGANIGFYTTIAGRLVGPQGSVFAFEPDPTCAQQVKLNADLNDFSNVTVVDVAVSDSPGTMTLQRGEEFGQGSTHNRLAVGSDASGLQVKVIAVDEWRSQSNAPAPTLVMIDVEGAEIHVLRGMLATIREHKPLILCEVHWLGEVFDEFVDVYLRPLGYQVSALGGEEVGSAGRWHAVLDARAWDTP